MFCGREAAPLTEESGSLAVACPLTGKHSSLWKMLSLHCGFTEIMSTSTILVNLAAWPSRRG